MVQYCCLLSYHFIEQICLTDLIALRELIIPIIVGSVLCILLLLVLIAYIIAFIRRRVLDRKGGTHYTRLDN